MVPFQTFGLDAVILVDLDFYVLLSCLPETGHVSSEVWKWGSVEDEGGVLLKS